MRGKDMIQILKRTLDFVDPRLVSHGERVAYILHDMLVLRGEDEATIQTMCFMALIHDVGAYKTDEIDRMVEFETKEVSHHAIYGYLYLRLWLDNPELAEVILYHHMPYAILRQLNQVTYRDYANMIHLADRIDIYLLTHKQMDEQFLEYLAKATINPDFIALFRKANERFETVRHIREGTYYKKATHMFDGIQMTDYEQYQYLWLITCSIDFRSEHTVNHTILVVEVATELAKRMGLSQELIEKVRLGATLHDIGKISTPIEVLEKPSALTKEETIIMMRHVQVTRDILEGRLDDEVCRIAYRHHERLSGKGYPEGLREEDLTIPEMIMAVADITSALLGKRSYKESLPKQTVVRILSDLVENKTLHRGIVETLLASYDEICLMAYQNSYDVSKAYENMRSEFYRLHRVYEDLMDKETSPIH